LHVSVASMLVNTNDAFTGIGAYDLSGLEAGDSVMMSLPVYDAGTEANSETAASIPGPAAGGEGYNEEREARNTVAKHAGVVSAADGLSTSALNESHRFALTVAKVMVTRTQ